MKKERISRWRRKILGRNEGTDGQECSGKREVSDKSVKGTWNLAAVIDLKNKEVIGYDISKNIEAELSMRALVNAIALRGRHAGLVFHIDRESQYSSRKYRRVLEENGITGSMSGHPAGRSVRGLKAPPEFSQVPLTRGVRMTIPVWKFFLRI